jgi:hypothetical protein
MFTGSWGGDILIQNGVSQPGGAPHTTTAPYATLELAWDNGTLMYHCAWNHPRAGEWRVGNDFDTSTLKTAHVKILKFKTYTSDVWPNEGWDGFHIFVFNFRGGMPGEMLWPTSGEGYFFKPSGIHGHVWVECAVDWTCPTLEFLAARDQGYNYPNCDPLCVDTNLEYMGHSWMHVYGEWSGFSETRYKNVMVRAVVQTGYEFPGVAPTSLGRVKALYY